MAVHKSLVRYPNLDTPAGDMKYEVERILSFYQCSILLTASQLSTNGFFFNPNKKKITCFSCEIEHDPMVHNIRHEPNCKFKQDSVSFQVDRDFEISASSFLPMVPDSISVVAPSPPPPSRPSKELDMKIESDRLSTFSKWNSMVPVLPTDLARNGFYFKGFGDVVVCAYCRLELRSWEEGDIVANEHRLHSPNCSFLASVLDSPNALEAAAAPLPTLAATPTPQSQPSSLFLTQNMNYEQNRLKSFEDVSSAFALSTKQLAHNGFYFVGPRDKVRCVSCQAELSNWKKDDNILHRHQKLDISCPFVQNRDSVSLGSRRSYVIFDRPKHPQFALLSDRLKTFANWPEDKKQTPEHLADAGFYHTGETDTVICYCCDGGLCNWDEDENPWVEHARWYPRCTYVRQRQGDQFVESVKRDSAEETFFNDQMKNPADEAVASTTSTSNPQAPLTKTDSSSEEVVAEPRIVQSIRKSPTFLAVVGLGYAENIVETVVKNKIKLTGSPFAKASLLLEAVVKYIEEVGTGLPDKGEQQEVEEEVPDNIKLDNKLREENRLLKEQKTCKICLDNDLSIVFLPCGHFVSCATCAPSLKTCPLCRSRILGLVRAYMS